MCSLQWLGFVNCRHLAVFVKRRMLVTPNARSVRIQSHTRLAIDFWNVFRLCCINLKARDDLVTKFLVLVLPPSQMFFRHGCNEW